MTQTVDLNKLGLVLMNEVEIQEIDGGGAIRDFVEGVATGLAIGLFILAF